eukprot:587158-Pyramimonas_sp.AAC.1
MAPSSSPFTRRPPASRSRACAAVPRTPATKPTSLLHRNAARIQEHRSACAMQSRTLSGVEPYLQCRGCPRPFAASLR